MPESIRRLIDALVSLMKPTVLCLTNREFDIFEPPVQRRMSRLARGYDYVALGKAMAEDRKDIHGNQDFDEAFHGH